MQPVEMVALSLLLRRKLQGAASGGASITFHRRALKPSRVPPDRLLAKQTLNQCSMDSRAYGVRMILTDLWFPAVSDGIVDEKHVEPPCRAEDW